MRGAWQVFCIHHQKWSVFGFSSCENELLQATDSTFHYNKLNWLFRCRICRFSTLKMLLTALSAVCPHANITGFSSHHKCSPASPTNADVAWVIISKQRAICQSRPWHCNSYLYFNSAQVQPTLANVFAGKWKPTLAHSPALRPAVLEQPTSMLLNTLQNGVVKHNGSCPCSVYNLKQSSGLPRRVFFGPRQQTMVWTMLQLNSTKDVFPVSRPWQC